MRLVRKPGAYREWRDDGIEARTLRGILYEWTREGVLPTIHLDQPQQYDYFDELEIMYEKEPSTGDDYNGLAIVLITTPAAAGLCLLIGTPAVVGIRLLGADLEEEPEEQSILRRPFL